MVKFEGEFSKEVKDKMWGVYIKTIGYRILIGLAILLCAVVPYNYKNVFTALAVVLGIVIFQLLFGVVFVAVFKNKILYKSIVVNNEGIEYVSGFNTQNTTLKEVTKIKDCGSYYVIYSKIFSLGERLICDKNAVTEGSIEKFEQLIKEFYNIEIIKN